MMVRWVRYLTIKEKRQKQRAGSKGGKQAATNLTAAERKANAKKAARARWAKRKAGK